MYEAALAALGTLFSWPYILVPVVGTLMSMLVAGLPGVSGVMLMALALPFLYEMDPAHRVKIQRCSSLDPGPDRIRVTRR